MNRRESLLGSGILLIATTSILYNEIRKGGDSSRVTPQSVEAAARSTPTRTPRPTRWPTSTPKPSGPVATLVGAATNRCQEISAQTGVIVCPTFTPTPYPAHNFGGD